MLGSAVWAKSLQIGSVANVNTSLEPDGLLSRRDVVTGVGGYENVTEAVGQPFQQNLGLCKRAHVSRF